MASSRCVLVQQPPPLQCINSLDGRGSGGVEHVGADLGAVNVEAHELTRPHRLRRIGGGCP